MSKALTGATKEAEKRLSTLKRVVTKSIEDNVNHPKHYNSHPAGIECIQVTRHMNFNIGNAMKYLWRTDHKNGVEDLRKAIWYINDEIALLENVYLKPKTK